MGLYVDNPHALCEKRYQLQRFCALKSGAEEGVSMRLKSPPLQMLYNDFLSTSAPEMPVSSSMASFCHQGYVEDETVAYNGSPGSMSPSSDSYDLHHGHDLSLPSQKGKQEPSYGLVDENNAPVDVHACDEFRMFEFKVRRCMRGRSHDWTECPFAHPGEKARRRDPRRYHYSGTACPDFRKGTCRRGDACEYAHGVFECWLHPARYRTQPCKDGRNCRRRVCFFAHTQEQMRLLPAAAAAASLTTIRSSAAAQPMKPTLQCHQPSATSFMSPQPSPASTPSLVSAFMSPCSTPGVQAVPVQVQPSRNGYSTTSAGLSLAISQTPPLSSPPSPSYSPPLSPQQGSPNNAMYMTNAFHMDGSDSMESAQGSHGRSHVTSNMQSFIGSQSQVPIMADPSGMQQHTRSMMAGTGAALNCSDLASLYHHSSAASGPHQQQASNAAAMTSLLNSFSAMNLHAGSPFWLQAQMALAAAHMQAQVEEQHHHHAQMHAESHVPPQMSQQMNLAVPVTSSPGPAAIPSAPQHSGLASSPPRRSFMMGLPSPASRVEKWMGEHPVVEDFDSAGEQPFVESGRSLRTEVFTKLLKRDESHSSLCGHADLEWVSDLVRDDKSGGADAMPGPGWDLWSHSWLNSHLT